MFHFEEGVSCCPASMFHLFHFKWGLSRFGQRLFLITLPERPPSAERIGRLVQTLAGAAQAPVALPNRAESFAPLTVRTGLPRRAPWLAWGTTMPKAPSGARTRSTASSCCPRALRRR